MTQIPHQPIRDALLNLIVYQGDTEFASVEQQRHLLETSPSDYDTDSVCRIMTEEMRHGWQMCHVLVNHFGETGKIEARKLLERRSWQNNRLLGSFNVDVDNWVDFFTYTEFVDRDGKFQLNMLSTSGFAPLARSMGPMLREEGFHLGTGHMGLQRIAQAGRVPPALLQKYVNKWVSTAYDLFGKDSSSSAEWFYVWGLKGRYDEARQSAELDKAHLNEFSRELYRAGGREAARGDQPAASRRRGAARRPGSEVSSCDRRVRGWDLVGHGRADDARGLREAHRRNAPERGRREEVHHRPHAGARLDRAAGIGHGLVASRHRAIDGQP